MRNGVHCFSDKIALQGEKRFDIFYFPPDTVNETSFELSKGKDGSFHMLNPCMNLVYKTTPIAMLFTKLIDRCQLDHRLANTIMFDKLPFKYDSNIFKGKRACSSNIPLPDCLYGDDNIVFYWVSSDTWYNGYPTVIPAFTVRDEWMVVTT